MKTLNFYLQNQQMKAKRARKLMQALGTPTTTDLKAMLRMNLIRNCDVKTEDVNLAEKVYGPDLGNIKGKSTRNKPAPITSDLIEIPDELLRVQEDVTLSMDGLTVNGLNFLTAISHNIYYISIHD